MEKFKWNVPPFPGPLNFKVSTKGKCSVKPESPNLRKHTALLSPERQDPQVPSLMNIWEVSCFSLGIVVFNTILFIVQHVYTGMCLHLLTQMVHIWSSSQLEALRDHLTLQRWELRPSLWGFWVNLFTSLFSSQLMTWWETRFHHS
jgi:hypothetical protein